MSLTDELKTTLANTISLYLRAAGYHWNVEGSDFREYHGMFGEIYADLYDSVDPLAENIRKLGDYAPYRLERLSELANLPEKAVDTTARAMASDLCDGLSAYTKDLNRAFDVATDSDEQGIADFLAGRIDACQKWCWFLKASTK